METMNNGHTTEDLTTPTSSSGNEVKAEANPGATTETGNESKDSTIEEVRQMRRVSLQGGTLKMTLSTSTESVPSYCGSASTISIRANLLDELENNCVEKRLQIVDPDGFIKTPLHIVKKLAEEFQTPLHSEVFSINHFNTKIWRVDLYAGKVRGIGQAPLRNMAFQMAAADMLDKIKGGKNVKVPLYGLPPGCRISPRVLRELDVMCLHNRLTRPNIVVIKSEKPFEEEQMFEVVCTVGRLETSAKSDSRFMARRMAAKEMYENLTQTTYPEMAVGLGSECVGLNHLRQMGIETFSSSKKEQWIKENRMVDGTIFNTEEEPNDGDIEEMEDHFDLGAATLGNLPTKEELSSFKRVIKNDTLLEEMEEA